MKQLQPRCVEELVALNALYRPGPMDYIPQYIDGKWKPETVHYPDPCLEDLLKETYGVMVYQEQVMQVAQRIAGFSLGGADMLRRAMGKKKLEVLMQKKEEFVEGALKQGFTKEHAEEIFEIMVPFAGYGFNKSHAAAYSVVAYRTGYLKAHFPAEFIAANLTNEITSTDKVPQYIAEGRAMGLAIDPPDVNRSDKVFDVVDGRIVYGLMGIKGLGEGAAEEIVEKRKKDGPYKSFMDFLERVDIRSVGKKPIELLIKTGAFDNLGQSRPLLLSNMENAINYVEKKKEANQYGAISLFEDAGIKEFVDFVFVDTPDWTPLEKLAVEKELLGFYISGHPLDQFKTTINKCTNFKTNEVARVQAGKTYTIIGMIKEIRTIITKKGDPMAFAKLEDFEGIIDLTFFTKQWEKYSSLIIPDAVVALTGKIDTSRGAPSFIVDEVLNPNELQEKSIQEVHIKLRPNMTSEKDIRNLQDFLLGFEGNCFVYFHVDIFGKTYILKANPSTKIASTEEVIDSISSLPCVIDIWKC